MSSVYSAVPVSFAGPSRRSGAAGRARPGTVVPGGMTSASGTDVRVVMPRTIPSRYGRPTRSDPDRQRPHRTHTDGAEGTANRSYRPVRCRLAERSRAYHPGPPETAARLGMRGAAGGMTLKMNVSVNRLFAFTVVTTAGAVLAMIAVPIWRRTRRARRLAMVDVALASSYIRTPAAATTAPVPGRLLEADAMPAELAVAGRCPAESTAVLGEVVRHDTHRRCSMPRLRGHRASRGCPRGALPPTRDRRRARTRRPRAAGRAAR